MTVKVGFMWVITPCCLCYALGGYDSSNVMVTVASPCRAAEEIVAFSEAYFTGAAFLCQRVKCRGVLEKIKYGPLVLMPIDGEMRGDEHIVHANKWKFIGIHRCNGDVRTCRCNDDDGYWQGLDGKRVIVEGVLSEPMPGDSMVSNEFMSPVLLESRISIDGGSSATNNVLPAEKQGISYLSPCREFKVTIYLANGGRYMIHYYSAVLWMAYVGPDRIAYITRPFPLYPLLADKKKIEKVWTMLNGLDKHIFPSANVPCRTSMKCRPKRYSQIKTIEIHNPGDELLKSVKELFQFVYEQQNTKV